MSIKVEVKHNGKLLNIEVPSESTLGDLKSAIAKATNVPPSMQKIMGKASLKNDQEKISAQGLSSGTKLMMIGSPVKEVLTTNTTWNEPTKTERKQKASCALPIDNYLPMLASMLKSEGERDLSLVQRGHEQAGGHRQQEQQQRKRSPDTDEDDDAPAVLDADFEEFLLQKCIVCANEEPGKERKAELDDEPHVLQSTSRPEERVSGSNASKRPPSIDTKQAPVGSPTHRNISQQQKREERDEDDNATDTVTDSEKASPYCMDLTGTAAVNNSKDTNAYYAMLLMEGVLSRINQYEAGLQDAVLDVVGEDMDHPLLRFSDLKNREMESGDGSNPQQQKNDIFIDCLAKSVNAPGIGGNQIRSSIAATLPIVGGAQSTSGNNKSGAANGAKEKEALRDRSRLAKVHQTLRKSLDLAQDGSNAETHTEILAMAAKVVSRIKGLSIGEWAIIPCGWVGQQSSSNLYILVGRKQHEYSSNGSGNNPNDSVSSEAHLNKRAKVLSPNTSTSSPPPPSRTAGPTKVQACYTVSFATSDAHIANELRWLGTHNNHEIEKLENVANQTVKASKFSEALQRLNPSPKREDPLSDHHHSNHQLLADLLSDPASHSVSNPGSPCYSNMQSLGTHPIDARNQIDGTPLNQSGSHQLDDSITNGTSKDTNTAGSKKNDSMSSENHRYVVRIPFVREERLLDDSFWALVLPLWMIANNPQAKLPNYCIGELLLDVLLPWLADAIPPKPDEKVELQNKQNFTLREEQRMYCPEAALHLPYLLPPDLVALFSAVGPYMEHRPAHKGSFLTQWLLFKDLEREENELVDGNSDLQLLDPLKRHRAENTDGGAQPRRFASSAAERHRLEHLHQLRDAARLRKDALKDKILASNKRGGGAANNKNGDVMSSPASPASMVGSPHGADFGSDADDYISAGSPKANRHKKSYFSSAKTNNYFSKNFSNNPHHGGATKALLEALHFLLCEYGMAAEETIKQVKFVLKYEHFVKAAEDLQLAARKHMPSMFDQLSSPIPPALLSPPYNSPVESPLLKPQAPSVLPVGGGNNSAFLRSGMSPSNNSSLVPPALLEPPNTPAEDPANNRPQQLTEQQLSSLQPVRLNKLAHGIDQLKGIGIDPTTHLPTLSDLLAAMGPRDRLKTASGVLLTPEHFTHSCKVVAVYFTASWSEPCKRIAPMVIEAYNKLKARVQNAENKLEFLLISCDRTRDSHEQYVEQFPFPRMTWPDESILKPFDLKEIPQLLIFAPNGQLMTLDGVDALLEDPEGLRFPHAPWNGAKPLSRSDLEILEFASTVLNQSALERFNERLLNREQLASIQNVIEAVKEVAQAMPHRRD